MDTIAEVGARVRDARKKQKMSQATLAEKVHISTSHISDFENGKSNISLDIFMRITEALGVSADSLIQTDTPVTKDHLSSEYAELFLDCTADEIRSIIKVASEYKSMLRKKL